LLSLFSSQINIPLIIIHIASGYCQELFRTKLAGAAGRLLSPENYFDLFRPGPVNFLPLKQNKEAAMLLEHAAGRGGRKP